MTSVIEDSLAREIRVYGERTTRSAQAHEEACRYLPGGDSRSTLHFAPHPLFIERGQGSVLWDCDGNEYVDFSSNHTSLVHGNAFAPVSEAIAAQVQRGASFPFPSPLQVQLARVLQERQPSLERIRFCSSGTEAVMNAIRAARAYTDRPAVAKIEGGYNGTYDEALISTHPTAENAGHPQRPANVPRSKGLSSSALRDVVVLPFNDVAAPQALLRDRKDLAAIIVEPVLGSAGMIPAEESYLAALRRCADEVGALLIFDEVISFRLSVGGAQETFGVRPDLTCLGKMIGGGIALGAFGGRHDVMAMFDPTPEGGPQIAHPGSMNANATSLAASLAVFDHLGPEATAQLNDKGKQLREALGAVANGVLTVSGAGSLFGLHVTDGPVRSYRDTLHSDKKAMKAIFVGLLNEGFLVDPRGAGCLSTVTTDDEVLALADALGRVTRRHGVGLVRA